MTFTNDEDTGAIQQFDFSVDLLQAILWQYNDATNLQGILNAKDAWYQTNQIQFWQDWYVNVFNLATANNFGLAVWSIILGQPIYINHASNTVPVWGLSSNNLNFDNGNFGSSTGATYQFSTLIARLLLQLRYFQMVSSGTVPETNRMLEYFFQGYGTVVLIDNHNMTQRYLFDFTVPSEMALMLSSFDILPRPAGVKSALVQNGQPAWGLGPNNANFDNGDFNDGTFAIL